MPDRRSKLEEPALASGRTPPPSRPQPARKPVPAGSSGAPGTGSTFRERLGVYLLGIAIGLVMLGMMWSMRNTSAQRRQQQQQQAPADNPTVIPGPVPAPPGSPGEQPSNSP